VLLKLLFDARFDLALEDRSGEAKLHLDIDRLGVAE
jgi:hypothetical protein